MKIGILFIFLKIPNLLEDQQIYNIIMKSIDYLLLLRLPSGNYPSSS